MEGVDQKQRVEGKRRYNSNKEKGWGRNSYKTDHKTASEKRLSRERRREGERKKGLNKGWEVASLRGKAR